MLFSPTTIKYGAFIFDPDLPKYHYIQIGFKEVSIDQSPEQIVLYDDLKCILHQYGLIHYVTGTIHGAMGDTYNLMEITVSDTENLFSLWDRGQLIVILSRTRIIKNKQTQFDIEVMTHNKFKTEIWIDSKKPKIQN